LNFPKSSPDFPSILHSDLAKETAIKLLRSSGARGTAL
jgi:hypothetical protein